MNYCIYPTKTMNITQSHTDGNHKNHLPDDFPFDEACSDGGRDWFYCPCDALEVVKLYGVGGSGVNTVWLQSRTPVVMPYGAAVVTIMIEHCEDDDLKKLSVGQIFRRGDKMFREGKDGATGNHFHISVGTGNMLGGGWKKNKSGAWVLTTTGVPLRADQVFFIDGVTIRNAKGYQFQNKPKEKTPMANKDNTPDSYAKAAIDWALKNKILIGDDKGNYKLHDSVTRQDMLVFLYRAINK